MGRKSSNKHIIHAVALASIALSLSLFAQDRGPKGPKGVDVVGAPGAAGTGGRKWAILVGVTHYDYLQDLAYCDEDVKGLYEVLTTRSGYHPDRVLLMTHDAPNVIHRPTRSNVFQFLGAWLEGVAENDTIFFCFSGHGYHSTKDGQDYLLTSDSILRRLDDTAIRIADVQGEMEASKARYVIISIDACRNIVKQDGKAIGGAAFGSQHSKLPPGKAMAIFRSCLPHEISREHAKLQRGVYSYFLEKALSGEADGYGAANTAAADGVITPEEAACYVKVQVPAYTRKYFGKTQTPFALCSPGEFIPLAHIDVNRLTLMLTCNEPDAVVWINGRRAGRTLRGKAQEVPLSGAATYRVLVHKHGFPPASFEVKPGGERIARRRVTLKSAGGRLGLALEMYREEPDMGRRLLRRIIREKDSEAPRAYVALIRDALDGEKLSEAEKLAADLGKEWAGAGELREADDAVWDAYQKQIGPATPGQDAIMAGRRRIRVLSDFLRRNPRSGHSAEARANIADARSAMSRAYQRNVEAILLLAQTAIRQGNFDQGLKHRDTAQSVLEEMVRKDSLKKPQGMDARIAAVGNLLAAVLIDGARDALREQESVTRAAITRKNWEGARRSETAIRSSFQLAVKYKVNLPADLRTRLDTLSRDLRAAEEADKPVLIVSARVSGPTSGRNALQGVTGPGATGGSRPGGRSYRDIGADVFIDGNRVGVTPLTYRNVQKGRTYEVAVRKRGHWASPQTVRVKRFGPIDVSFVMKESALPPGFEGSFIVPTTSQDQYGNPVRRGTDAGTGYPNEVWLKEPKMEFVLIPAGEFVMGSPSNESGRDDNERQRRVRLTKPFYMAKYEITQGQWQTVMNEAPWSGKSNVKSDSRNPAGYISWDDWQEFVKKLGLRLPTEAEWEYACRAGSTTAYCFGDDDGRLKDYAWYEDNAADAGEDYAHGVGLKKPNAWGLYDMHGNVWEWCQGRYGEASEDFNASLIASYHVYRDGSFRSGARDCRSAVRNCSPGYRASGCGARPARSLP